MKQYNTITRIAQGCACLTLAAAIGTGILLQHAPQADAVELPEETVQAIGSMLIPAVIREVAEARQDNERMLAMQDAKREKLAAIAAAEQDPVEEDTQEAPVMTYIGSYKVTGYDTCIRCCGNTRGITASGTTATVGRTCAAPARLAFGTRLYIEGIGERIVEDRGGAVTGKTLDVLCEDHAACYAITGHYDVYIVEG